MINVYQGMKLTPEQERQMFKESFEYIVKKLDLLINNPKYDIYDYVSESAGSKIEDAAERANQMIDYFNKGHWD